MSVITPENTHEFKDAYGLFSKANRFLSTYKAANLVDEGLFPSYVKEVIRALGIGVYKEQESVIAVKGFKALLPDGFQVLHAAYKCSPVFTPKDTVHPQGTGFSVYNDITWEVLGTKDGCEIECCENNKVIEKITIRQHIQEKTVHTNFTNPVLLRLSPNVKKSKCTNDCLNLLASSPYEITIDGSHIYTNFDNDNIYLKYYELACDDNGVPQIADIEELEKAIEWYIIWQESLRWWYNNQVGEMERRVQYAEAQYNKYYSMIENDIRFPSFSRMVNLIRRNRTTNKVQLMRQIDRNGYWQCN